MRNVIVTGANGFVGSSLIRKLVLNDVHVVAIDASFADNHLPESAYVSLAEIEINNADTLMAGIPEGEYDAFYHFAWRGVNGVEKSNPIIQLQNIQMALICANVANNIGCKKFLCAGTIAERAIESLPHLRKVSGGMMYGTAKHSAHLMLETYCKSMGLDFVWMQFSNIYGPNNKTGNLVSYTLGELMKGNEATFGPASQPYDFIYVDDLIEAIFKLGVGETACGCYFIGSGEPRILKDYLYEIGEKCGHRDFIKIGARPDDGIVYTMDMFSIERLVKVIGVYVSRDFSKGITDTLKNYSFSNT